MSLARNVQHFLLWINRLSFTQDAGQQRLPGSFIIVVISTVMLLTDFPLRSLTLYEYGSDALDFHPIPNNTIFLLSEYAQPVFGLSLGALALSHTRQKHLKPL